MTYENQKIFYVSDGISGTPFFAIGEWVEEEIKQGYMMEELIPNSIQSQPGIYIWEGTVTMEGNEDWEGEYEGTIRTATVQDMTDNNLALLRC